MDVLGKARAFGRKAGAALRRRRRERELDEEIRLHIELRVRSLVDSGMDPRDAACEARRIFGNAALIREEARDMWSFVSVDTLIQDTRFGARLLRRSPLFTVAAVASLAIGIGAATAVFSLADRLLFRTLPVQNADELVIFRWISGPELVFDSLNGYADQTSTESSSTSFSRAAFERLREQLAPSADVFAFADLYRVSVAVSGRPETASAHAVSGNYFDTLGLRPAAGRLLSPPDAAAGAPPAAVIGYDFWQRRFGGRPDAVGELLVVNGISFTIAGVLPRGFTGTLQVGQPCDVMVPLSMYGQLARGNNPEDQNFWWILMMGRLRPGVSRDAVQSEADAVLKATVQAAKPDLPSDSLPRVRLEPGSRGQTETRNSMREPFKIIVAVVGVVLLVACANVANLLLARGRARTREVAVRAAIGAPRSRIVRQLFTEGLLLGLIAAAGGLVLTRWIAASVLPALVSGPGDITGIRTGVLDPRVLAFSSALAVACSILFGLGPALRTARASLVPSLQDGARGVIGDRRRFGSAGILVVAQVALSMLLLTAAGLLTWSAHRLQSVDPGFETARLLTFSVDTTLNGYEAQRARAFFAEALARLRALPGVTHVSLGSHRLIANSAAITFARPEGPPPHLANSPEARAFAERNRAWRLATDERFHETLGIPMLRGTSFAAAPDPDGPQTAVVNARLARQLFGTVDAVGRRFVFGMRPEAKPIEITGVVADAHYSRLKGEPPPTVYLPYQQSGTTRATFNVRTAGDPMGVAETVRETMRQLDDTLPIFDVRTQEEQVERSIAQERLFARLALLLGAVALALSGMGVYGLLAYTVSHRTAEIGVRMAFGAERRQVQWLVLRQSLILIGAGLAIGIPAAVASGSVVQSLLFGLTAYDPRAVSAAAILMASVGLLAAFVPAYRASRIDPLRALRAE